MNDNLGFEKPRACSGVFYFCSAMKITSVVLVLLVMAACTKKTTNPNDYFSSEDQKKILWQVVHYASKLPPTATHETKFDPKFDDYYRRVLIDFEWKATKPDTLNGYYFLIFRPARSINPMFEGIGGRFVIAGDSLAEYEEIFRTWKMAHHDLGERGAMLFDRMTRGKDLSLYYSKYAGDKYIEFPDGKYFFDKQARRWRNQELDSLKID